MQIDGEEQEDPIPEHPKGYVPKGPKAAGTHTLWRVHDPFLPLADAPEVAPVNRSPDSMAAR